MTTVSSIIQQAFREANSITIGTDPSTAEQTEGFNRLLALMEGIVGTVVGESLTDWPIGTTGVTYNDGGWNQYRWTRPPANVRLLADTNNAQTIYLPNRPCNGARIGFMDILGTLDTAPITLDGNGRLIEGMPSITLNTPSQAAEWLYRADLGGWVRWLPLDPVGEMPFPVRHDSYFVTRLALRLAPTRGKSMSAESASELSESEARLRADYHQIVRTASDIGVLMMSRQAWQRWRQGVPSIGALDSNGWM